MSRNLRNLLGMLRSLLDKVKTLNVLNRAEMLAVSVKIFRGDAVTVVKENTSLLQDIPQTLRLGFPDVVFPGDVRNELYVKLWSGDFMSTNGTSGRISVSSFTRSPLASASSNVQVTVEVRDQDGRTVESVISQGSGEPLVTQFPLYGFPAMQRTHIWRTYQNSIAS